MKLSNLKIIAFLIAHQTTASRLIQRTAPTMDDEVNKQISAEQILKEVYDKRKVVKPSTEVDVLDLEELHEYQRRKRAEYETYLKRNRLDMGQWLRYAKFEVEQHDIRRARSIFERALSVDNGYIPLWIRYIDTELKLKFINHARNLLDRAINTLPRVDKLWYKYLLMEESLGNTTIVRSLFTQWTSLEPHPNAWDAFVAFEVRQENWENARDVFSRFVLVHPQASTWKKWIQFESTYGDVNTVRKVYSLAVDTLTSFSSNESEDDLVDLIESYASWESSQQEYERCRALYDVAIKRWPHRVDLKNGLVDFEKKFGSIDTTEESVIHKRKRHYEELLRANPRDYDTWWLYLDLVQTYFNSQLLETFEKSVSGNEPDGQTKNFAWRQYIYLWIRFLAFVELELNDIVRGRDLYKKLVDQLIPHKQFTFSKIWLMYAKFELRQGQIDKARKILGRSLGMCPKDNTFKGYIDLEIRLKQFDRVRKIYEKYLEFNPLNLDTWINYAELEENLGDGDRCRSIYEIAIDNAAAIGLSEESKIVLMQRAIEFETDEEEYGLARQLYNKYIEANGHLTELWIGYALYESSNPTEEQLRNLQEEKEDGENEEIGFEPTEENIIRARNVFERAVEYFRRVDHKRNRAIIFDAYKKFEDVHGSENERESLRKRMPKLLRENGFKNADEISYVFPDDERDTDKKPNISKFMALAKRWNESKEGLT